MRAVAVLAVVAAHAVVPGLHGGFIGVDVFFVLSGFLITQLIVTGIRAQGRFAIGTFYTRRARRIVPAASLVLAVTVVASIVYFNFIDALDATRDAVWAAFFGANIRFATQGIDYFSLEDSPSPLQHFWSLAVEEQFYLAWPLLIGLAVLLTWRRRTPGSAPLKTMALFALVGGGASFAWSIHRTVQEPTSAYFSSFTRAWELAAGALLAIVVAAGYAVRRRLVAEVLAVIGLGAIVWSVVFYDESMAFPGYEAALPVGGAVLLLLAGTGAGRSTLVARVLDTPPLRRIGDWSYSLYLWHWPLIVIPQVHMGRPLSATETLIAVALTFQLSYLTYRFVEQPFRSGAFWRVGPRGLALYPLSLVLVLPTAIGGHAWAEWLGTEHGDDPAVTTEAFGITGDEVLGLVRASVVAAQDDVRIPSNLSPDLLDLADDIAPVGDCNYQQPARPLCRGGDVASDRVIVVTGDSHARAWIPAFDKIATEAGYATYYLVKQQCAAAFVDPGQLGTGDRWPECEEFHQWVTQQVSDLRPELMVVATSPPPTGVYDDSGNLLTRRDDVAENLVAGFDDMFATYVPLVGRMVLLSDVPRLPEEPGACLAQRGATLGDCVFAPTSWSEQNREISEAAAARAGVESVDPTPWLCADQLCPVVIGSTIAYRDRGHISATRAGELWWPLGVALGLLDEPTRAGGGRNQTEGGVVVDPGEDAPIGRR
ncbi:acyltransferase family protein [soil metagenome]